jgi:hypothetical protein
VLAIRIDPTGERISVLGRETPARGDAGLEPAVLRKAQHFGAALARHLSCPVAGPVVDDEDIGLRKLGRHLREHRRQVLFRVPGRDEDDQVVRGRHAGTVVDRATLPRWLPSEKSR